jgi:hypothetical protein
MKPKNLILLVAAAAGLTAAAVMLSRHEDRQTTDTRVGSSVLPPFDINAVAQIDIVVTGMTNVLQRQDRKWVLASRYGYPADFEKIRNNLIMLEDLTVGQVVQATSQDIPLFKLGEPGRDEESAGTRVALKDKQGNVLASLLIGAVREAPTPEGAAPFAPQGGYADGQYVATADGSIYLVGDILTDITPDPTAWIDTELLSVPSDSISAVTVRTPDGKRPISLHKPEGATGLVLDDLEKDETMDTNRPYKLGAVLSYLRFQDIADPSLGDAAMGLDNATVFRAVTDDGNVYTVHIGSQHDDAYYVRISAEAVHAPETAATEASEKAGPKPEDTGREQSRKAITDLNTLHGPWTYLVSSYYVNTMTPSRDDLVKPGEDKVADDANTAAGSVSNEQE